MNSFFSVLALIKTFLMSIQNLILINKNKLVDDGVESAEKQDQRKLEEFESGMSRTVQPSKYKRMHERPTKKRL